jgi:hypothetical protein
MQEKWILISVCDRDITVLDFDTKEAAYDKMIEELGFAAKGNISDYDRENGDYDFDEDGAWLSNGNNQSDYDWTIHRVSF